MQMKQSLVDLTHRQNKLSRLRGCISFIEKCGGKVDVGNSIRETRELIRQDLTKEVSCMSVHEIIENASVIARLARR
jgi:hypothetical protein